MDTATSREADGLRPPAAVGGGSEAAPAELRSRRLPTLPREAARAELGGGPASAYGGRGGPGSGREHGMRTRVRHTHSAGNTADTAGATAKASCRDVAA